MRWYIRPESFLRSGSMSVICRSPVRKVWLATNGDEHGPLSSLVVNYWWQWMRQLVITVYFLSRQIRPQTLHCLLLRRGYDRSTGAIERKVFSITQQHPHLRTSEGHWDLQTVDSWIDDLLGNHESVNTPIRFSEEDAEHVVLVSHPLEMILTYAYSLRLKIEPTN